MVFLDHSLTMTPSKYRGFLLFGSLCQRSLNLKAMNKIIPRQAGESNLAKLSRFRPDDGDSSVNRDWGDVNDLESEGLIRSGARDNQFSFKFQFEVTGRMKSVLQKTHKDGTGVSTGSRHSTTGVGGSPIAPGYGDWI